MDVRLQRGNSSSAGARLLAAFVAVCLIFQAFCLFSPCCAFADDKAEGTSAKTSQSSGEGAASPKGAGEVGDGNMVDPAQRADNSFIYDTTIDSLFNQASIYDGRTVQVYGEVIGDLIQVSGMRDRRWITLTSTDPDNKATISALISSEQAKQIDHYGRYGVTGTILQVRGTYHQACSEHDGLPDIHATSTEPLARGVETPDRATVDMFIPGIVLVVIGVALMGAYYFARERAR